MFRNLAKNLFSPSSRQPLKSSFSFKNFSSIKTLTKQSTRSSTAATASGLVTGLFIYSLYKANNSALSANNHSPEGDYHGALEQLKKSVDELIQKGGENQQDVARLYYQMAHLLVGAGELEKSIEYYTKALVVTEKTFGRESFAYTVSQSDMAAVYMLQDQPEKSIVILEDVLKVRRKLNPDGHDSIAATLTNMGYTYIGMKKIDKAIDSLYLAYEELQKVFGEKHHKTVSGLYNLAMAYKKADNKAKAVEILEQVVKKFTELGGEKHQFTERARNELRKLKE